MRLYSKKLAGREFNFQSVEDGQYYCVVSDDGEIFHWVNKEDSDGFVVLDGYGVRLLPFSVEQKGDLAGEPDLQYFRYPSRKAVPKELKHLAETFAGESGNFVALPAHLVAGVAVQKGLEELPDEIAEELLASTALGPFVSDWRES